jgi:hypothetical protein
MENRVRPRRAHPRPDFSPADGSIAIIEAPRVLRASAENGPLSALIDPREKYRRIIRPR